MPAEVAVLVGVAGDEGTLGEVEPLLVAAGVVGAVQLVIEEHGETADGDADGEDLADLAVDAGPQAGAVGVHGRLELLAQPGGDLLGGVPVTDLVVVDEVEGLVVLGVA